MHQFAQLPNAHRLCDIAVAAVLIAGLDVLPRLGGSEHNDWQNLQSVRCFDVFENLATIGARQIKVEENYCWEWGGLAGRELSSLFQVVNRQLAVFTADNRNLDRGLFKCPQGGRKIFIAIFYDQDWSMVN